MVIGSPSMVRSIKEAVIIGCGSMGERHAKYLISQGLKIKAFADPLLAGSDKPYLYADAAECLHENADGRLVVITSPSYLHAEHAIEAIYSGARALFIEKPVTVNDADAYHLQELADTHQVKIVVGFNFRFHGGLNNLVDSLITPHYWMTAVGIDDITTWPSYKNLGKDSYLNTDTGGMLWTSGSHAVDIALFIHGEIGEVLVGEDAQGLALIQRLHHIGGGVSVLYNKWEEGRNPTSILTYVSPSDSIVVDMLSRQSTDMHKQLMFNALEYYNKDVLHPNLPTLSDAIHGVNVLLAAEESMRTKGPVLL